MGREKKNPKASSPARASPRRASKLGTGTPDHNPKPPPPPPPPPFLSNGEGGSRSTSTYHGLPLPLPVKVKVKKEPKQDEDNPEFHIKTERDAFLHDLKRRKLVVVIKEKERRLADLALISYQDNPSDDKLKQLCDQGGNQNQNLYACPICPDRKFETQAVYSAHMKYHRRLKQKIGQDRPIVPAHQKLPDECEEVCGTCDKKFTSWVKYKRHLAYHKDKEEAATAAKNGVSLSSPSSSPAGDGRTRFICGYCGKGASAVRYVKTHSSVLHPGLPVKYHQEQQEETSEAAAAQPQPPPEETAKNGVSLSSPSSSPAGNGRSRFFCGYCGKGASAVRYVKMHSSVLHPGMPVKYHQQQETSEAAAAQPQSVQVAVADNNTNANDKTKTACPEQNDDNVAANITCKLCPSLKFPSRTAFLGHILLHKDSDADNTAVDEPIEYICKICPNRKFTNRRSFDSHQREHARLLQKEEEWSDFPDLPVQDEYVCEICGLVYKDRSTFITHLNCGHETVASGKPPPPPVKSAKVSVTVNRKGRNPTWRARVPDQESYSCTTCPDRSFTSRESYIHHLAQHRRLMKLGRDRQIPTVAAMLERKSSNATPHQDTYKCSICENRTFLGSERISFLHHLKKHAQIRREEGKDRPILSKQEFHARLGNANKDYDDYDPHQDTYKCNICENRTFLGSERISFFHHLKKHAQIRREEGKDRPILSKQEFHARLGSTSRNRLSNLPDQESYRCEICPDRIFDSNSKARYLDHLYHHRRIKEVQGRDRPILTQEEIKRAQALKAKERRALLEDSVPNQETYICEICPSRSFSRSQKAAYIQHVNYHEWIKRREGADRPILTPSQRHHGVKAMLLQLQSKPQSTQRAKKTKKPIITLNCSICPNRTFSTRKYLRRHMLRHEAIKEKEGEDRPIRLKLPETGDFHCSLCDRNFSLRSSYKAHVQNHRIIVRKEGQDRRIVSTEETRRKIPRGPWHCDICNKTFDETRYSTWMSHQRYHQQIREREGQDRPLRGLPDQEVYTCKICKMTYQKKRSFLKHMRNHRQTNQEVHTCPVCKRTYKKKQSFLIHVHSYRHTKAQMQNYRQKNAEARARLLSPENEKVAQSTPSTTAASPTPSTPAAPPTPSTPATPTPTVWTCEICSDRTYEDHNSYKQHLRNHRKILRKEGRDRPMNCDRTSLLYRSIPDQESYTCDLCPQEEAQVYPTKARYYDHLLYHRKLDKEEQKRSQSRTLPSRLKARNLAKKKSKLQDQTLYRCSQCVHTERTFRDRKTYLAHLYNHAQPGMIKRGEAKGRKLRQESVELPPPKLQRFDFPVTQKSPEKNKVECGECGKQFVFLSQLVLHQQESCRRSQCSYSCHCGERFHSPAALDLHKVIGHGEDLLDKCSVCTHLPLRGGLEAHVRNSHPEDYLEFVEHQKTLGEYYGFEGRKAPPDLQPEFNIQEAEEPEPADTSANSSMDLEPELEPQDDDDSPGNSPMPLEQDEDEEESVLDPHPDGDGIGEIRIDSVKTLPEWTVIPGLEDAAQSSDPEDDDEVQFLPIEEDVEDFLSSDPFQEDSEPEPEKNKKSEFDPAYNPRNPNRWNPNRRPRRPPSSFPKTPTTSTSRDEPPVQCDYCGKVTNGVRYIKMHSSRMHPNRPFKFHQILDGSKPSTSNSQEESVEKRRRRKMDPKGNPPASTETGRSGDPATPSGSGTATIRTTTAQDSPSASEPDSPAPSTSTQPLTQTLGPSKSVPVVTCTCPLEETTLGLQKRCTGASCACYTKHKQCSSTCGCKTKWGNPFQKQQQKPDRNQDQAGQDKLPPAALDSLEEERQSPPKRVAPVPPASASESPPKRVAVASAPPPPSSSPATTLSGMMETVIRKQLNTNTLHATTSGPSPGGIQQAFFTSGGKRHLILVRPQKPQQTVTSFSLPLRQPSPATVTVTRGPRPTYVNVIQSPPQTFFLSADTTATIQVPQQISTMTPQSRPVCQPQPAASPSTSSPRPSRFCGAIYRCFCEHDSYTLTDFLKHQWTHRTEELFICPVCRQEFSVLKDLIAHVKARHTDGEAINLTLCTVCEALLSSQEELSVHYAQNHPVRILCDVCHQSCGSIEELNAHRGTHPICSICKTVFLNQIALRGHLAKDHVGHQANPSKK